MILSYFKPIDEIKASEERKTIRMFQDKWRGNVRFLSEDVAKLHPRYDELHRWSASLPTANPRSYQQCNPMLRKDSGEVATVVRAEAEILGGHSAVAWFEGVSGCYSIEGKRVRPMPLAKP